MAFLPTQSSEASEKEVQLLQQEKTLLLYGQADYVERIHTYFMEVASNVKISELTFQMQDKRPEKTVFDFQQYDCELDKLDRKYPILIAFSMNQHEFVRKSLDKYGFVNVHYYTADMENALKRMYFSALFTRMGKSYLDIYALMEKNEPTDQVVKIYMTKCVVDKPLSQSIDMVSDVVVPIQAGKAMTEKKVAEVTDDKGINISNRNRHYSEMTVAYWVWKNSSADYIGMSHYRRLFVYPEKIALKLRTTDIEAVLPLPTLYLHALRNEYFSRYIPDVWETMIEVLDEMHPEYHDSAQKVFSGKYFYGNNMWVLRRDVLDKFFSWMFPMLFEIEKRIGELADPYYNRYTGFCSELFTTLYFLDNRDKWKIAYAEKIFLN